MTEIEYGYCQCGCGKRTSIAPQTDNRRGWVRGEPVTFVPGHHIKQPLADRFWSKVDRSGGDDTCWIWIASFFTTGYGQFLVGGKYGKKTNAHRVAWELTNGKIPDGLWVLHNCPGGDNPACVNPSHMFLGTHQDNMRDMISKGRQFNVGDKRLKVTADQVIYIRERYALGGISEAELAKQIGISQSHASSILSGKCWKSIK